MIIRAEVEKHRNQEAAKILIDIVHFVARPFISTRDGSESDANSNFHQLVLLLVHHCPVLKVWLDEAEKKPQHATYLNWKS